MLQLIHQMSTDMGDTGGGGHGWCRGRGRGQKGVRPLPAPHPVRLPEYQVSRASQSAPNAAPKVTGCRLLPSVVEGGKAARSNEIRTTPKVSLNERRGLVIRKTTGV